MTGYGKRDLAIRAAMTGLAKFLLYPLSILMAIS